MKSCSVIWLCHCVLFIILVQNIPISTWTCCDYLSFCADLKHLQYLIIREQDFDFLGLFGDHWRIGGWCGKTKEQEVETASKENRPKSTSSVCLKHTHTESNTWTTKKKKKRKRKSWRSTLHWIWSTVQAFHELLFTYKQWVRETSGMTAAERFSSATFVFTPGMETWWYEGFVSCGGHFYPKHLTYPKYMFSMVTQQEGNWRWQRRRHRDEQFMTSVYLSDFFQWSSVEFLRLGETLRWIWLNEITNITGVGPL